MIRDSLIEDARKFLSSCKETTSIDIDMILDLLCTIPIDPQGPPTVLMTTTSVMETHINALTYKFGSILDEAEQQRGEFKSQIAGEVIKNNNIRGRSTPSHVIEAALRRSPEFVSQDAVVKRLSRLMGLLDGLRWQVKQRSDFVELIVRKGIH